jgi:hypothetical protein
MDSQRMNLQSSRTPPKKQPGQGTGPRRFDGELLDVRGTAAMLGTSEKLVRSRVERRLIPFRRLGGRIVFLRDELTAYQEQLPGCDLNEALANLKLRTG